MNPEEIEIKLDLANQDNYRRLIDNLGICQNEFHQENIFIDTIDKDFKSAEKTVRIRRENDTVTLTIKGKSVSRQNGLAIRPEINIKTDISIYNAAQNNTLSVTNLPRDILNQFGELESKKPLVIIVAFENNRRQYSFDTEIGSLLLVVDATEYPDGSIEYELELELADKNDADLALKYLSNLLENLDIPVMPQNDSKFTRALRRQSRAGYDR